MRTYARVATPVTGVPAWVVVETDANGNNDAVYLATLIQVLLLNRGESPVYGDYGVPSMQSVQTQIPPDLYVAQTQAQFAPFFGSLTVSRATDAKGNPIYNIRVVTNAGAILTALVQNGLPAYPL